MPYLPIKLVLLSSLWMALIVLDILVTSVDLISINLEGEKDIGGIVLFAEAAQELTPRGIPYRILLSLLAYQQVGLHVGGSLLEDNLLLPLPWEQRGL